MCNSEILKPLGNSILENYKASTYKAILESHKIVSFNKFLS